MGAELALLDDGMMKDGMVEYSRAAEDVTEQVELVEAGGGGGGDDDSGWRGN